MKGWSDEHPLGGELLASSPLTPTAVGMSTAAATSEISLGVSLLFVTFIYFDFILLGGTRVKGRGQVVGLGSLMPPCGRSSIQVPS